MVWIVIDENENIINKNPDVEHLRNLITFKDIWKLIIIASIVMMVAIRVRAMM